MLLLAKSCTSGIKDVSASITYLDACPLEENPKSRISSHNPHFKMKQYDNKHNLAQSNDITWLLAHFWCRYAAADQTTQDHAVEQLENNLPVTPDYDHGVNSQAGITQPVCLWFAYNSLTQREDAPTDVDNAFGLPIINAPAHEWVTLATALNQLSRLNALVTGSDKMLIVTFDMNLYKSVNKLEYLESKHKDKWVLCSGAFHTVICALRCLVRAVEGSGLDES